MDFSSTQPSSQENVPQTEEVGSNFNDILDKITDIEKENAENFAKAAKSLIEKTDGDVMLALQKALVHISGDNLKQK